MGTYNRARYLAESIQSILDQSFKDFDIIIIDDGSTDNTEEILSDFPVRYLGQENQGPAAALNKAIELSQAEYIAFQGSDDIFLPEALTKSMTILDNHPEVAFSHGQAYLIDEAGQVFGLRRPRGEKHSYVREGVEEIRRLFLWGNHITACTVMARRSCIDEVGLLNPSFRNGSEDFDLWVRLSKKYSVAYIAEPLAKYRIHRDSMGTSRNIEEIERSNTNVLEFIFNDSELGPAFSTHRESAYAHLYLRMASIAYSWREIGTARKYLFRASSTYPRELMGRFGISYISLLVRTMIPSSLINILRYVKYNYLKHLLRQFPTEW